MSARLQTAFVVAVLFFAACCAGRADPPTKGHEGRAFKNLTDDILPRAKKNPEPAPSPRHNPLRVRQHEPPSGVHGKAWGRIRDTDLIERHTALFDSDRVSSLEPRHVVGSMTARVQWRRTSDGLSGEHFILQRLGLDTSRDLATPEELQRPSTPKFAVEEDGEQVMVPAESSDDVESRDGSFFHVLEVGFGSGDLSREMRLRLPRHAQIHGVETSTNQVARAVHAARQEGLDYGLYYSANLGFGTLPYRSDFFAGVVAIQSMSYTPNREKTLCELFRVLQPGGMLVLQDIVASSTSTSETGSHHVDAVNWALDSSIGSGSEYLKSMKRCGFENLELIPVKTIASTTSLHSAVDELVASGGFSRGPIGKLHPQLTPELIAKSRIEYATVAVANAVSHDAIEVVVVAAQKPSSVGQQL